jgi:hypothetical protein
VPDPSQKSFIFTLTNPHNLASRIFKQNSQDNAIWDNGSYGSTFGNGFDLHISEQCQSSTRSYSKLGSGYINDTRIAGNQVLAGAQQFAVEEIEVFEVIQRP